MHRETATEQLRAELTEAGLVTVEGEQVTLTQQGARLGRQLAMSGEDEQLEPHAPAASGQDDEARPRE